MCPPPRVLGFGLLLLSIALSSGRPALAQTGPAAPSDLQAHPGYLSLVLSWTDVESVVWEYRCQSHADRVWTAYTRTSSNGDSATVHIGNLIDKQTYTFEVRGTLNGVTGPAASIDAAPQAQLPSIYRSVAYERSLRPGSADLEPTIRSGPDPHVGPMLVAEERVTGAFSLSLLFPIAGTGLTAADFTVVPAGAATIDAPQSSLDPVANKTRWIVDVTPVADGPLTIRLNEHAVPEGNQPVEIRLNVDRSTPARVGYMAFSSPNAIRYDDGPWTQGAPIDLTLQFSERVTVSGSPSVNIAVGQTVVEAGYHSGSGTEALVFRYVVSAGFPSAGDIRIASREIDLASGTIVGSDGASADLTLPLVATAFEGIRSATSAGTEPGDVHEYRVLFNEPVIVVGRPHVQLRVQLGLRVAADYVSGSGSDTLVFRYVVPPDHELPEEAAFWPDRYLRYPDGAAIYNLAAAPVDTYPRLPGLVTYYELSPGASLEMSFRFQSWPAQQANQAELTPSIDVQLLVDQPTKLDISPTRFTRTRANHLAKISSTFTVTVTEHAKPGDIIALDFQLDAPLACCGWHQFTSWNWRVFRVVSSKDWGPEIVLRSEKLPVLREQFDLQGVCLPTRVLGDCRAESRVRWRGWMEAPRGMAMSVLPSVDDHVAETAFEVYATIKPHRSGRWPSRFQRIFPSREQYFRDGEHEFWMYPGQYPFLELRLWLIYPFHDGSRNSVRLSLGPYVPPLTVCVPLPTDKDVGYPFLAVWENPALPWSEQRWRILDTVPGRQPDQICARTPFFGLFVVLRSDDPLAGLHQVEAAQWSSWQANRPIAASELLAALPESTIVIRAESEGEVKYHLRSQYELAADDSRDLTIEPGQELLIFDKPLAAPRQPDGGRRLYWRAGRPITASELLAAVPESIIVIRAVRDGEVQYRLRTQSELEADDSRDLEVLPGEELLLFSHPRYGLREAEDGRWFYWTSDRPIAASRLLAALPESAIVIRAESQGEVRYHLRTKRGLAEDGSRDLIILPGQKLLIFD